jgi:hypothetical protein
MGLAHIGDCLSYLSVTELENLSARLEQVLDSIATETPQDD